jgi:hypothetical protein
MQIELAVAIIIAAQVGTTTALGVILKMVIKRLDKQNGSITDLQKWQLYHTENQHGR